MISFSDFFLSYFWSLSDFARISEVHAQINVFYCKFVILCTFYTVHVQYVDNFGSALVISGRILKNIAYAELTFGQVLIKLNGNKNSPPGMRTFIGTLKQHFYLWMDFNFFAKLSRTRGLSI
jgi:hypothetical protein